MRVCSGAKARCAGPGATGVPSGSSALIRWPRGLGGDHPVAADVGDARCTSAGMPSSASETNSGRTPISLRPAPRGAVGGGDGLAREDRGAVAELAGQHVHAGRADEVADEGVRRALEEIDRRADLHHLALVHHHDLVGEGQRLGLVVGDVDHRDADLLLQLLELGAELPFQVRVDDGQRLVEHDDGDVLAHEAAAHRDLLLAVGGEAGGAAAEAVGELQHLGDGADAGVDRGGGDAAVAEREGEIVVDGHRVVDDRELEHLGDVALDRRQAGHVAVVEEHAALGRHDQARDDVEQRGLAAAGGAEQRVGAAVGPLDVDLLQRIVLRAARLGAGSCGGAPRA